VSLRGDLTNGFVAEPTLNNNIVSKVESPFQEHFFPYDGCESGLSDLVVITVHELLNERLQNCKIIGSDSWVKEVCVFVDLIPSGVEIRRERTNSRQHVVK